MCICRTEGEEREEYKHSTQSPLETKLKATNLFFLRQRIERMVKRTYMLCVDSVFRQYSQGYILQ